MLSRSSLYAQVGVEMKENEVLVILRRERPLVVFIRWQGFAVSGRGNIRHDYQTPHSPTIVGEMTEISTNSRSSSSRSRFLRFIDNEQVDRRS